MEGGCDDAAVSEKHILVVSRWLGGGATDKIREAKASQSPEKGPQPNKRISMILLWSV